MKKEVDIRKNLILYNNKRSIHMKMFPLAKRNCEIKENEQKILQVDIPENWWSSNNSAFFDFNKKKISKVVNKKSLPNTPGWNIKKGDYRVREDNIIKHDYLYYRNLKIKIRKYLLHSMVVLTIVFVFTVINLFFKT